MTLVRHIWVGSLVTSLAGVGGISTAADVDAGASSSTAPAARIATIPQERPQFWFGVAVENIPPAIAKQLKLKSDQGLMVVAVLPNTPAEKAGLKPEDLLIELDGVPLTSQEDLARAANSNRTVKLEGEREVPTGMMKRSRIAYLREGDRKTATLTPSPRPENMMVVGNNLGSFVVPMGGRGIAAGDREPGMPSNGRGGALEVRNIVLPNGVAAQVGPGYAVDLSGEASTVTVRSIRQLMSKGDTVVLSQQTDTAGHVKNTITVGKKSYTIEPGNVKSLPEDLRPLAEQMLQTMPPAPARAAEVPAAPAAAPTLDDRMNNLEKQNGELLRQLEEMRRMLQDQKERAGGGGGA